MPSSLMLSRSLIPDAYGTGSVASARCLFAEHHRVAPTGLVPDLGSGPERGQLVAQPRDVSPQGLLGQMAVVPGLDQQPVGRYEARRAAHEQLEQLELALGEHDRAVLIGDRALVVIDLESLELPLPPVPEVQPAAIPLQLRLEHLEVAFDNVCPSRFWEPFDVRANAIQQLFVELDHLAVEG